MIEDLIPDSFPKADTLAIDATDVTFAYGSKEILRGVDLQVRCGEVLGLLGPNGAGKSTLLGVLTGDLTPSGGQASILGKPVAQQSHKELAMVRSVMPQRSEFPFAYLARDIALMGRAAHPGAGRSTEDERLADLALEACQVAYLADRDVTRLSGGEQARVTMARVLAQQAPVVFLDEPTAALDISHQQRIMQICRELAAAGAAVVAVMHELQLAAAYCDRVALMRKGQIRQIGDCDSVLTSELLSDVYEWPISVCRLEGNRLVILPDSLNCPFAKPSA